MKFGVLKDFSEQHLIDCDSNKQGRSTSLMNYGCTGGWPEAGFDYVKYNGIVEDMYYPYKNSVTIILKINKINLIRLHEVFFI